MAETKGFESWGIVEVMGHSRYAGFISESSIGGAAFIRVDVPETKGESWHDPCPAFTKFLGSSSIFAITPTTEDLARRAAEKFGSRPITVVDLTPVPARSLPPPSEDDLDDEDDPGF